MFVFVCGCVCEHLYVSEMNDSNDTRDRKEELGIFCLLLTLPMKQYSVI